ncbi:MAG: hypothetical protein ABH821_02485 [archaeon]
MQAKALMIFEEDLLDPGFNSWIESQNLRPLHRFEGLIELGSRFLEFSGNDKRTNSNYKFKVFLEEITDVYYGWDRVFGASQNYSNLATLRPLRISFGNEKEEKNVYFFIGLNNVIHTTKNLQWFNELKSMARKKVEKEEEN